MNIVINKDNVQELWGLYEEYLNAFYKRYYKNVKSLDFEDYVKTELFKCENCGEYLPIEFLGDSELAMQDTICQMCMEDGYGK